MFVCDAWYRIIVWYLFKTKDISHTFCTRTHFNRSTFCNINVTLMYLSLYFFFSHSKANEQKVYLKYTYISQIITQVMVHTTWFFVFVFRLLLFIFARSACTKSSEWVKLIKIWKEPFQAIVANEREWLREKIKQQWDINAVYGTHTQKTMNRSTHFHFALHAFSSLCSLFSRCLAVAFSFDEMKNQD